MPRWGKKKENPVVEDLPEVVENPLDEDIPLAETAAVSPKAASPALLERYVPYNDFVETRAEFVKRVSVDGLMEILKQPGAYNKTSIAKEAYSRAVELADLLGLEPVSPGFHA